MESCISLNVLHHRPAPNGKIRWTLRVENIWCPLIDIQVGSGAPKCGPARSNIRINVYTASCKFESQNPQLVLLRQISGRGDDVQLFSHLPGMKNRQSRSEFCPGDTLQRSCTRQCIVKLHFSKIFREGFIAYLVEDSCEIS